MGCLNSNQGFSHWFANLHFSGICNRSCYFCIGQHMMALDPFDNLNKRNLDNFDEFIIKCQEHNVGEVNFTGSNTDPLLYKFQSELIEDLRKVIPGVKIGLRTNGALALRNPDVWKLYDKASVSITTFQREIYRETMGQGSPPNLEEILKIKPEMPVKVNLVLCPETTDENVDYWFTLTKLRHLGIKRVNLREPYGQPHIGDPLAKEAKFNPLMKQIKTTLGMPTYDFFGMEVTYWDVHYVEVESVNLYANGIVSVTYPITKGHDPVTGDVKDQENFQKSGRIRNQWLTSKKHLPVIQSEPQ